jgi:beta-1,4-mannosyl-glycoprotein beta-1,4-N-acetylglucosaminyltransferase
MVKKHKNYIIFWEIRMELLTPTIIKQFKKENLSYIKYGLDKEQELKQFIINRYDTSNDIIITSDCDEIPNPEILQRLNEFYRDDEFYSFTQTCYNYYLNVLRESHINNIAHRYEGSEPYTGIKSARWKGSKMSSFKMLKNYSLNEIRMQPSNDIENGGWHFSFMGGAESIKQKLMAGCIDRNYDDIPKLVENIEKTLKNLSGITYNDDRLTKIEIDDSFPEYLLKNLEKYKHLLL